MQSLLFVPLRFSRWLNLIKRAFERRLGPGGPMRGFRCAGCCLRQQGHTFRYDSMGSSKLEDVRRVVGATILCGFGSNRDLFVEFS